MRSVEGNRRAGWVPPDAPWSTWSFEAVEVDEVPSAPDLVFACWPLARQDRYMQKLGAQDARARHPI